MGLKVQSVGGGLRFYGSRGFGVEELRSTPFSSILQECFWLPSCRCNALDLPGARPVVFRGD